MKLRVVARVRRRHEPEAQEREEHERPTSNLLDHVGLELGGDLDLDHGLGVTAARAQRFPRMAGNCAAAIDAAARALEMAKEGCAQALCLIS